MSYMPQEIEVWYVIPAIRRELAKAMKEMDLKQQKIADNLGITVPAVSQYVTGKRGKDVIFEKDIITEVKVSAKKIMNDSSMMVPEIQKLLTIVRKKGMLCKIAKKYHKLPKNCKACMEFYD